MNRKIENTSAPPTRTRYGKAHPERAENALWLEAIKENWCGYALRRHVGTEDLTGCCGEARLDHSHSSYREIVPGPYWSWDRFGRTSTTLPDGRIIRIAGEHEDSYDPDFCIYNDVIVEYPCGRFEIYLYPKHVFPPTDFHSATLIGQDIILIGSLGYHDLRRPGDTQLLKLDTKTLRIEKLASSGDCPGWISKHTAEQVGDTTILVVGGMVQTKEDYETNRGIFELDLTSMTWRRRRHGDIDLFPISDDVYRTAKNPRYGTVNPERDDNVFWLEMARRQWTPSRARLHFGDVAPPEPELTFSDDGLDPGEDVPEIGTPEAEARLARMMADVDNSKLKRGIDDVVWTAVREDSAKVTLPNGRKLVIGGEVLDYGNEYADPWVYNDIIVTHPGGAIAIFAYPKEVFPHLIRPVGVVAGEDVYIFGILDRKRHSNRSRGPAVLRLDTRSYEIAELEVTEPAARVNVYPGAETHDANRVIFPLVRCQESDPKLCIAFDLDRLTWGEPFPQPDED